MPKNDFQGVFMGFGGNPDFSKIPKMACLPSFMVKKQVRTICAPPKTHKNTLEIIFGHF